MWGAWDRKHVALLGVALVITALVRYWWFVLLTGGLGWWICKHLHLSWS